MQGEKKQSATETEEDRRSQLGLTNLAEFIFDSISGSGKMSWLMRCWSWLYALCS